VQFFCISIYLPVLFPTILPYSIIIIIIIIIITFYYIILPFSLILLHTSIPFYTPVSLCISLSLFLTDH